MIHKDLYFIAIVPPREVREQVVALQLEMKRHFRAGHALKSPPHITLQMPFRLAPELLGKLENVLSHFATSRQPFILELDGFDCFAPRVIFIRVRDHGPVKTLATGLKSVLLEKQIVSVRGGAAPLHPHMTVATRDLDEARFATAWAAYQNRSFKENFKVNRLILLKHNGKFWDTYTDFEFEGSGELKRT